MRLSTSCAAAAAIIGSSLLVGCTKNLPASPVAAPLSDTQAIAMAEAYLDLLEPTAPPRIVKYVEPTAAGDGHFVSFRTAFHPLARPPIASRLVEVGHDGTIREIRFREDE